MSTRRCSKINRSLFSLLQHDLVAQVLGSGHAAPRGRLRDDVTPVPAAAPGAAPVGRRLHSQRPHQHVPCLHQPVEAAHVRVYARVSYVCLFTTVWNTYRKQTIVDRKPSVRLFTNLKFLRFITIFLSTHIKLFCLYVRSIRKVCINLNVNSEH